MKLGTWGPILKILTLVLEWVQKRNMSAPTQSADRSFCSYIIMIFYLQMWHTEVYTQSVRVGLPSSQTVRIIWNQVLTSSLDHSLLTCTLNY